MNGFWNIDKIKFVSLVQYLALCLGDPGKISLGHFVVFQASTGKKLQENNHGDNYRTYRFDAKHSPFVVKISPKVPFWELYNIFITTGLCKSNQQTVKEDQTQQPCLTSATSERSNPTISEITWNLLRRLKWYMILCLVPQQTGVYYKFLDDN